MRPRMFAAVVLLLGCTAGVAAQTAPAGVVEYYHVDALGSVRAVTSATGAIVRTHHYHPFGEGVESGADPMRFTGKPRDGETGLDYFGARYYSARTGRFTTIDPALDIERTLDDPQRWSRYASSLNNPLKYVDADGKWAFLVQLAQRVSPYADRAARVAQQYGRQVWVWATGFFNGRAGQGAVQTAAELMTGSQAPPSAALSVVTKSQFLDGAITPGRGGVSAAGRALQSHAIRAGSWLSGLTHGGNAAENTSAARGILEMILNRGQATLGEHPTFGQVIRVRLPDGSGAWWKANGEFIGFLERYTPK